MLTSLSSCLLAVDSQRQISQLNKRHFRDIIKTQRCCREMKSKSLAWRTYRWLKSIDQMGPGLSSERKRKREGVLLAIRRRSNGVFQFAVAGNERRLKPGQLFCPRRGGDRKRREREEVACGAGSLACQRDR